jgi:transcriptional regulator with XRE-family HTH domain
MTQEKSRPDQQKKVGLRIKAAREGAGLSMRAAARQAGISDSRWRQIEMGYQIVQGKEKPANPSPEMLATIAATVNLGVSDLLLMAGFDESDIPDKPVNNAGSAVLDMSDLTLEQQAKVRGFVAGLRAANE